MPAQNDFPMVFEQLKRILTPYAKNLTIQVITERPVAPPAIKPVISTEILASTEAALPTSTEVTETVPPPLECTYGIDFVTARRLQDGVYFSFDVPIDIPYNSMDNSRNIDLGDTLTVYINSSKVTDYKTAVYEPSRPNRLFIQMPDFRRGDGIQIQLKDAQILYCSPVQTIHWIDSDYRLPREITCNITCIPDYENFCESTCTCVYYLDPCP